MTDIPKIAVKIIRLLEKGGASDALIVGGFVRDSLIGLPSKDVDIEVYGLSYAKVIEILKPHFHVDLVGQSFGVVKVNNKIDVALPRRESKSGLGHKGFDVESFINLSPEEAFARRDFTINAIGMRLDGSFCDPYDGREDIKNRLLRATSPAFKDDPLRVLRGMQFAARFGYSMDEQTVRYCREVFDEFQTLSKERIWEEWKKWALKGLYPEKGLDVLLETGWIKGFPELDALVGCPQNPKWHPEGDVWTHTRAVCREMSESIRSRDDLSEDEQTALMFAALCHDFGKPSTTKLDENGDLRSLGHAAAGAPLAVKFLEDMRAPKRISALVEPLVANHMATQKIDGDGPTPRTVRRLARRLAPANIRLWALLCQADAFGCGAPARYLTDDATATSETHESIKRERSERRIRFQADLWLEVAEQLDVANSEPLPILLGRDLIELGLQPGREFGIILKRAMEAQLDGIFSTKEEGMELVKTWLSTPGGEGADTVDQS